MIINFVRVKLNEGEVTIIMDNKNKTSIVGLGIVFGAAIGSGLGVVFNNVAIGAGIGVGVGIVFGAIIDGYKQQEKKS